MPSAHTTQAVEMMVVIRCAALCRSIMSTRESRNPAFVNALRTEHRWNTQVEQVEQAALVGAAPD